MRSVFRFLIVAAATLLAAVLLLMSPLGASTPFYPYIAALLIKSEFCTRLDAANALRKYQQTDALMTSLEGQMVKRQGSARGPVSWSTPRGEWWFPASTPEEIVRYTIAQHIDDGYDGLQIRPGDVVLDCGGFVGDYAKTALSKGAGKVIVVEPSDEALACIRLNHRAEIESGRVVVYAKGVWDREERLWLSHQDATNPQDKAVGSNETSAGEWIDLTTVDRIVEELKLDRLDAIKLDVEGAESRAIAGARNTLQRFKPRLAVATEHTSNRRQNNVNVISTMRTVAPSYVMRCGYCYIRGDQGIMPETLYFLPR